MALFSRKPVDLLAIFASEMQFRAPPPANKIDVHRPDLNQLLPDIGPSFFNRMLKRILICLVVALAIGVLKQTIWNSNQAAFLSNLPQRLQISAVPKPIRYPASSSGPQNLPDSDNFTTVIVNGKQFVVPRVVPNTDKLKEKKKAPAPVAIGQNTAAAH